MSYIMGIIYIVVNVGDTFNRLKRGEYRNYKEFMNLLPW